MKKIALLAGILVLFSVPAFASKTINSSGTTIGSATYKPSNNVQLNVSADDTHYAATSKNTRGNVEYGTNSTDSRMYYKDKNDASGPDAPASSVADFANSSGWSAM